MLLPNIPGSAIITLVPVEFDNRGATVGAGTVVRRYLRSLARLPRRSDPLPEGSPVTVVITYFSKVTYSSKSEPGEARDVDNLAKPIMDAMKGIVYSDDAQVSELLCRIKDFEAEVGNLPENLAEYLRESRPVVHVTVDPVPNPTVEF